jgi:hypothetical protein
MHYGLQMDKPTVYIETTIVSYLTADPSRHPVTLVNQLATREWWSTHRDRYALFTSRFVVDEAMDGDPVMAQRRLALLTTVPLLAFEDTDAERFAKTLCRRVPMPPQAHADALHIALAAIHGMAYVLTWNCKHIANPHLQPRISAICREWGYAMPVLCTPTRLM